MTSTACLSEERTQGPRKTEEAVDHLMFETSRLLVADQANEDFDQVNSMIAPSKVAPPYVQQLIENPDTNEEESSASPFNSSCSRSFEEMQMFRRKIQEEDRLSNMYKLRYNFSSRFDNRAWIHPHGTTNFDFIGIPSRRRVQIEGYKTAIRKDNYKYLGSHPEIQAIIGLFLKKLLTVQPLDAADYLAEYFSGRLQNSREFERQVEDEMKKLSLYHVKKMRDAGKIIIQPGASSVPAEKTGEEDEYVPEMDGNYFKEMNIGALAQDFSFNCISGLMAAKENKVEEDVKEKKQKKKHKYCGCKDWKLKKNQKQSVINKTNPTLGTVDTLATSEEGESEEGEESISPADAERIASELVHHFLNPDDGVYSGHGHYDSLWTFKNIQ